MWRAFFFLIILVVLVLNLATISGWVNQATVYYSVPFELLKVNSEAAKPMHIKTPGRVKAVYMSSWVAGSPSIRDRIIKMIDTTELNSVVIDVKDSTGRLSFKMSDPLVEKIGSSQDRVPDIRDLIDELHQKNIYVIGRIAVFEDPYITRVEPDLAVKTKAGAVWRDHKGLSWANMASAEYWDYIVAVALDAYKTGFDELNFDYIRFPSDGNMEDISYSGFDGQGISRSDELKKFFAYLSDKLKIIKAPISADLFGMTTTAENDMGIGQIFEDALPYFSYIDPMVYPSHYPPTFDGYKNPADHPYEIITYTLDGAVKKALVASSTPDKIRPWLQDFDLGAVYTAPMVRDEIKATYDVGLNSWLLWDAANKYTPAALEPR